MSMKVYIALTANFWGKGRTEKAAIGKLKEAGGSGSMKKHGHIIYEAHPETVVTDMGGFRHPRGCPPVKIADHRKGV